MTGGSLPTEPPEPTPPSPPSAEAAQSSDLGGKVIVYFVTDRAVKLAELLPYALHFFRTAAGVAFTLTVLALVVVGLKLIRGLFGRIAIEVVAIGLLVAAAHYYATRVSRDDAANRVNAYGGEFSRDVTYGRCLVTLPVDERVHQLGQVERPFSFFIFQGSEDPDRHVVVQWLEETPEQQFFDSLADSIHGADGGVLLFVHGYNVEFADAIRRTAQIAHDLKCTAVPVTYSWPSHGELLAYPADQVNADRSAVHLAKFIENLSQRTAARQVYVIAHSMGNRVLSRAALLLPQSRRINVAQLVLAAPDVDAQEFTDQFAPRLRLLADRITLYASSNDSALKFSERWQTSHRAGETDPIVVVEGIDTIDASLLDTSMSDHSYYGDHRSVLSDIFYTITESKTPDTRFGLRQASGAGGKYWKFSQ
jgi:esterase/lipase superfamily enzyme